MRVLHLLAEPSLVRAAGVQALQAAEGLVRRGHDVWLASRPDATLVRRCGTAGIAFLPLPLAFPADLVSAVRLVRVVRSNGISLVHAHGSRALAFGLVAAWAGVRFSLVTTRGTTFPLSAAAALKYRSRRLDRVVAVCQAVRDAVLAGAGLPARKVVVVYGGVDVDRFSPQRCTGQAVRAELGLAAGVPLVGHVGVRSWKGWGEALRAFVSVPRHVPEARLLVAGCARHAQFAAVRELAAEMGLADRVLVTGLRSDLPEVLAACDVVIDPSWAGTGITGTLRESMALARPVVAARVGGNPELVEDGVSGLLVDPRVPASLAAGIVRLLRDHELAGRMGAAARARVLAHFTSEQRCAALESLYADLVNG